MSILPNLASANAGEPLKEGDPAPQVSSVDHDGKEVDLAKLYGPGFTLVYFYPKADTPGCKTQACTLRDAFTQLQSKGIVVIGVSTDKPEAQKAFRDKYQLPFTLLADFSQKVVQAFGVPATNGIAARQSFLIKDGKVVWRNLKEVPSKQAEEVLQAVADYAKANPGR
ncbi:peroxiredoxin [Verrucomicrobia bacterium LW23]|nr:peroxiredoxin [Verrucomicrobia bacterium LW23]